MKKILVLIICLISINSEAKTILSGIDPSGKPFYFDDSLIVSYGKMVTAKVKINDKSADTNEPYVFDRTYVYFCSFDNIEISSYKTDYFDSTGKYKNSSEGGFSESTFPISINGNSHLDSRLGWSGFRNKLRSKCSQISKKLPRLEVPLTRSETDIYHIILDTIKTEGNIKSGWLKNRNIVSETLKNEDGSPMIFDGQEVKNYSLAKDKKYSMEEFQVDCKREKTATTQVLKYDSNGNITDSKFYPLNPQNMVSVVPNSIGEVLYKFMCGL